MTSAAEAAGSATAAAVRAHVEAFNAKELDAVVAGFAEDAVFAAEADLVVGARALRGFFGEAFANHAEARLEILRSVIQGDTAACELRETITVDGQYLELDLAAFFTVRGGVLVRVRVYRDASV